MRFSLGSRGRTILSHLYRKVPIVVQGALYFDEHLPQMPCVYVLSSGGPVVEGDRYTEQVVLEPHTMAHLSTGAATLVASMESGKASRYQSLTLHDGAYLEWLPQPLIPGRGADYESHARVVVAPEAALFRAEVVAPGRLYHGERFDYHSLLLATTYLRPDGRELLREHIALRPHHRSPEGWALLGGFSHFASVAILAPRESTSRLYTSLRPIVREDLRMSIALLADGAGLSLRLLANSSQLLLELTRELCSLFRQEIKGVPLAEEFPWRRGVIEKQSIV